MDEEGMEIYGIQRPGQAQGPQEPVRFDDPERIDWGRLAQEYRLTPEQVQELQVPSERDGPGLEERLRSMLTRGGVEWGVSGNQVTGTVRY